jgi:hypothetical protein
MPIERMVACSDLNYKRLALIASLSFQTFISTIYTSWDFIVREFDE